MPMALDAGPDGTWTDARARPRPAVIPASTGTDDSLRNFRRVSLCPLVFCLLVTCHFSLVTALISFRQPRLQEREVALAGGQHFAFFFGRRSAGGFEVFYVK